MIRETEDGPIFCLECGSDRIRQEIGPADYKIKGRSVRIEDDWHVRCLSCGEISHPGKMLEQVSRRIADQIRREDNLLTADELQTIRLRYGFSQTEMEKLIGSGEKTWIRWERGKVVQSPQYDAVIRRIAEDPSHVAHLMAKTGVENATAREVISDAQRRSERRVAETLLSESPEIPESTLERIVELSVDRFREAISEAFSPAKAPADSSKIFSRHCSRVPVDVEAIALDLGIRVHRDPNLGRHISGKIVRNPGMGGPSGYAIFINSREVAHRQRYTLAHEIAHFVLHRDRIGDGITENAMHRGPFRDAEEREADMTAAAVLMPEKLVREAYRTIKSIAKLADKFKVSYDAMRIRLDELKL